MIWMFVCTGNTCRSPMAAALARMRLVAAGRPDVAVFSAGLHAAEGDPATPEAVAAIAAAAGADLTAHRAHNLEPADVFAADRIFTMTRAQAETLRARFPGQAARIAALDPGVDVFDPFGRGQEAYDEVVGQIAAAVDAEVARHVPLRVALACDTAGAALSDALAQMLRRRPATRVLEDVGAPPASAGGSGPAQPGSAAGGAPASAGPAARPPAQLGSAAGGPSAPEGPAARAPAKPGSVAGGAPASAEPAGPFAQAGPAAGRHGLAASRPAPAPAPEPGPALRQPNGGPGWPEHAAGSSRPELTAPALAARDAGPFAARHPGAFASATAAAAALQRGDADFALVIAQPAAGACIAANRLPGARAAWCRRVGEAVSARADCDANILCLSPRGREPESAAAIVERFLVTRCRGGAALAWLAEISRRDAAE